MTQFTYLSLMQKHVYLSICLNNCKDKEKNEFNFSIGGNNHKQSWERILYIVVVLQKENSPY